MENFQIIKKLGDGNYGHVWRAMNKQTGQVVAIKKLNTKYYSWEECLNLTEFKSLQNMNHPNIVLLHELIQQNNDLYFVFENMDCSLYQFMEHRSELFSEDEIRRYCFQILQGLAYMHQRGYFHRDLKLENILVSESKEVAKLADFGMVREIGSNPPFTEYVTTRWYRAPEVLLKSKSYGSSVDMWAIGAIMAELYTFQPLFAGSSELDQIYKICSVIGSPTESEWAEGVQLACTMNYKFPEVRGVRNLSEVVRFASQDAIDLISSLCSWDPCKRPTAMEALKHPFFRSCYECVHQPPGFVHRLAVGGDFLGKQRKQNIAG